MAARLVKLAVAGAAAALVVFVWAPHSSHVARAAAALTGTGSCDPASVRPNSLVLMTCTTRLTNEGDAPATNLTVNIGPASDCGIPVYFAFLDRTRNGELEATQPQGLSFTIPDLPAGQTNVSVTRVVIVNGSGNGRTGGSISVSSQDDPSVRFSGNICWNVSPDAADPPQHLRVTKQALTTFTPPGPVPAQAQFEIDVSNVSNQEMTDVKLLDDPLNGSTVVTSDPPATGADSLGRPSWSLGTLAAAETRRIVVTLGGSCVYADSIALATATSSHGTIENYPTLAGPSVPVGCTQPANTTQATATVISSLPYADGPVALIGGTPEPGAPHPSCNQFGQGPSLWYRYHATADGVLIADTAGSTAFAVLAVWQESGSGLTEVDCSIGYPSALGPTAQARSAFHATAGQTYVFQVIGAPSATTAPPSVAFHLASGIPPANDSFSHLTAIGSLPFSDSSDTTAATTQFGEPQPSCAYGIRSTIWYRYSAAANTLLVADTIGSDYGPTVGVWTDSKFGLAAVGCASGSAGLPGPIVTAQPQPARLAVHAEAGKNYYFQIGGGSFGLSFGHLSFHVAVGAAPANDDFANATAISSLPFTETVDALTASTESGEPTPSCFPFGAPERTVWYRYTPSQDGYVKASSDLPGISYVSPPLAIYTGNSLNQLTEVSCSSGFSPQNEIGFRASAGATYYFQVTAAISNGPGLRASGSASSNVAVAQQSLTGQVTFHLDTLAVPSCAPPQVTAQDAVGDVAPFGFPPAPGANAIDITSIAGGSDGVNYCVQVQFADPLPAPRPPSASVGSLEIGFDIDNNPATGYPTPCAARGIDRDIRLPIPSSVLIPLYGGAVGPIAPGPPQALYAFALSEERSITLIVPQQALGGSGPLRFVVAVFSAAGLDCAPDHGTLPGQPALSGDANCDGRVDSIDSLLILQYTAGLVATLPCPQAADVTNSGAVGPIDATLILQYSSGLLPALPVSRHR